MYVETRPVKWLSMWLVSKSLYFTLIEKLRFIVLHKEYKEAEAMYYTLIKHSCYTKPLRNIDDFYISQCF